MLRLVFVLILSYSLATSNSIVLNLNEKCDDGDSKACFDLGLLYDFGEDVCQDKETAAELYEKSCNLGNARGCYNQGLMYANGESVEKDRKRAIELYKKGCELGYKSACVEAGIK